MKALDAIRAHRALNHRECLIDLDIRSLRNARACVCVCVCVSGGGGERNGYRSIAHMSIISRVFMSAIYSPTAVIVSVNMRCE